MAETRNYRRYCLGNRQECVAQQDNNDTVWKAKQEAEPGTALPSDFPSLTALATAGYTTDADLDGADADELVAAGLTRRQAEAALTAFDSLP